MAKKSAEHIQKVRRIAFAAKQAVLDKFSGLYASRFPGPGLELEDIREFQNGDDVRAISWAKSAQMGKPFVKNFREERDLTVVIVADISASLEFGSCYEKKRERQAEIGALLAMSAVHNHDKVGLLLFSDRVEKFLPPRHGMGHGAQVVRELLAFEAKGMKTDIALALRTLYTILPKRAIVFLLSDFLDTSFETEFMLTSKKNDLIAITILDPYEKILPALSVCTFQNIESGTSAKQWLVDINASQIASYQDEARVIQERNSDLFLRSKAGAIQIDTKESFLEKIVAYFLLRKRYIK